MRQEGFLTTRRNLDDWSLKRPAYPTRAFTQKDCLNGAEIASNYYIGFTPDGDTIPTFEDLSKINIAEIIIRNNNSEQSRSVRVGHRIYGSGDPIKWTGYQSIGIGQSCTYILEGFSSAISYAVYLQEFTQTEPFYIFQDSAYVSTVTGYGFFQTSPIVGLEQKSTKKYEVNLSSMNISLRVMNTIGIEMDIHLWGSSFDYSIQNSTDHTFDNVPFSETFSIEISGVNARSGYDVSAFVQSGSPESFDTIYSANDGCEYEFNTGNQFETNLYVVEVLIPQ